MSLCGYEVAILRRVAIGDVPDDPGAAFFTACEVLARQGCLKSGEVTAKGHAELRLGMWVEMYGDKMEPDDADA